MIEELQKLEEIQEEREEIQEEREKSQGLAQERRMEDLREVQESWPERRHHRFVCHQMYPYL